MRGVLENISSSLVTPHRPSP